MSTTQAPASADGLMQGVGADLERLLSDYSRAYDQLSGCVAAHREAIRSADTRRITAEIEVQGAIVERIAALDGSRRSLIAAAMRNGLVAPGPDAKLSSVAAALPEPQKSRLVRAAIELRDLVARVQKEQSGLRLAAGALASHMEGLIRHVARRLSHAGVYSRRGVVEGMVLASSLDIRR